jgi:hypothetical protein
MICIMNGCHAESLGEALPFVVHNGRPDSKQIGAGSKKPSSNIPDRALYRESPADPVLDIRNTLVPKEYFIHILPLITVSIYMTVKKQNSE